MYLHTSTNRYNQKLYFIKLYGIITIIRSLESIIDPQSDSIFRSISIMPAPPEIKPTSSLSDIAQYLSQSCKGILASDESTGTIGKRLTSAGIDNTPEERAAYRQLFYTADIGHSISGAILFEETLYQSHSKTNTSFVTHLLHQGVLPGVKVDKGLIPLPSFDSNTAINIVNGETRTKGLDTLDASCKEYIKAGARFTKWRAALKVPPSPLALDINASELAMYAAICQANNLVPLVEPELLIDGQHTLEQAQIASAQTLQATIAALWRQPGISFDGLLLKPQMVVPGGDCPNHNKPSPESVAIYTVDVMRQVVPPAIPGIMFLSGGQTEEEATLNLNAINAYAMCNNNRTPWSLSFSFGRALQASVLKIWSEERDEEKAKKMAEELARVNGLATTGSYSGPHPSILSGGRGSLREDFRGWRTDS
jgi:fructose-bisphosphate aldolase, class I